MVFIQAIILCAGKGTRLLPLTENKPKAMVKVLDKPIIHWIFDKFDSIKIDEFILITGYMESTLKSYIKYNIDKDVKFIHQKELTGTADAIYLAKDYIKSDFLVLAGDTIFSEYDLRKLRGIKNSLLYTIRKEKLYEFGTLDLSGPFVKYINEKSTTPSSSFVNCSAYHFTRDIFNYIPKTPVDERFGERIITNTINLMIGDGKQIYGIPIECLNEISHPEDIEMIEERLRKDKKRK